MEQRYGMKGKGIFQNKVMLTLICCYIVIIAAVTGLACRIAYSQRQGELLFGLDMTLVRAVNEYENLTSDFWNIYIPMFETDLRTQSVLREYFSGSPVSDLTAPQKMELAEALRQMAARDDSVRWVAVISGQRAVNYAWFTEQNTLQPLGEDFPYWEDLSERQDVMEVYGERTVTVLGEEIDCITMTGGMPGSVGEGTLMVGFDTDMLERICRSDSAFETLQFDIMLEGECLFTTGSEPYLPEGLPDKGEGGILKTAEGTKRYVQVSADTTRWVRIYYSMEWNELSRLSHRMTGPMLLGVAALVAFSLAIYVVMLHMLNREMNTIRHGLAQIGENHLESRIEGTFYQVGFSEIASSINAMAASLKENIDRAYYYELKQKEAELQELQAKFNPHFLYNSLELFCARCYQNGDEDTAELIAQTAAIFRGFIGSATFIPIRDELAFTRRYLKLFRARYADAVQIQYDFDSEVLDYGIVRNVLQPLVENYFVHGINPARNDNCLCFHGHILNEELIRITVEDNGLGMREEELDRLNRQLHEPIATEKESYGLKNLHQRLRLFYGEPCGLELLQNADGGIIIQLLIRRMPCQRGEQKEEKTGPD